MARSRKLPKDDQIEYDILTPKYHQEIECSATLADDSRLQAYARYFGVKPTDYANYNFTKWSEATKYLGKRFYELQGEETFKDEHIAEITTLKRSNTSNSPEIELMDSYEKPKTVSTIMVFSTPNPSPEYTKRLLSSLTESWGKPSGGNGKNEWIWNKREFSSRLKFLENPKESILGLTIDAK